MNFEIKLETLLSLFWAFSNTALADPVSAGALQFWLGHQHLSDRIQSATCKVPGTQSRAPSWPTLVFQVSCCVALRGSYRPPTLHGPPFFCRMHRGVLGRYVDGRSLSAAEPSPGRPSPQKIFTLVPSLQIVLPGSEPSAPPAAVPGFIQRCPNDQCWSMPMEQRAELDDLPAPFVPPRGPLLAAVMDLSAQFFGIAPKDVKAPRPIKSAPV